MSVERNCPRKALKPIRKTVSKTRKKIRKTIRNATKKVLAPIRPLKNISLALSTNYKKFFTAQNLHKKQKKSPRGSAGVATLTFACQCIVSPRRRALNRTVTQMRHPLLLEGRPNCARQSLASTLSAPRVAATLYCDPGRHANVVTPCLLSPV